MFGRRKKKKKEEDAKAAAEAAQLSAQRDAVSVPPPEPVHVEEELLPLPEPVSDPPMPPPIPEEPIVEALYVGPTEDEGAATEIIDLSIVMDGIGLPPEVSESSIHVLEEEFLPEVDPIPSGDHQAAPPPPQVDSGPVGDGSDPIILDLDDSDSMIVDLDESEPIAFDHSQPIPPDQSVPIQKVGTDDVEENELERIDLDAVQSLSSENEAVAESAEGQPPPTVDEPPEPPPASDEQSATDPATFDAMALIQSQVDALEADNATLQAENANLVREQVELRNALAKEERQRIALSERLTQLDRRSSDLENERRDLRRQLNKHERANATSGLFQLQKQKEVEQRRTQVNTLKAELDQARRDLSIERSAHEATRHNLEVSSRNLSNLEALRTQLADAEGELANARDSRAVLAIELDTAQTQLEAQLTSLREEVERRDEQIMEFEAKTRELEAEHSRLSAQTEELAQTRARLEEVETNLSDLRANNLRVTGELEAERQTLESRSADLAQLKEAAGQRAAVESQLATEAQRRSELEAENEALSSKVAAVETQLQQADAAHAAKLSDLEHQLQNSLEGQRHSEGELQVLREQRRATQEEIDALSRRLADLQTQHEADSTPSLVAETALDSAMRTPRFQPKEFPSGAYESITDSTETFSPLAHLRAPSAEQDGIDDSIEIEPVPLSPMEMAPLQEVEVLEATQDIPGGTGGGRTVQVGGRLNLDERDSSLDVDLGEEELPDASDFIIPADTSGSEKFLRAQDQGIIPVRSRTDPGDPLFDESVPPGLRLARILNQKPVFVGATDMRKLNLDSRAAYLLSRMDGTCTFGDLMDASGLPPNDTAEILLELVMNGVI